MPTSQLELPHHAFAEWIEDGYLWRPARCRVKNCGLPILEFYLPTDFPYRIDPETYGLHSEVCGDRRRVRAMRRAEDLRETGLDRKSLAAGDH